MVNTRLWKWLKWIFVVYLGLGGLFYFLQDKFFFQPDRVHPDSQYEIPFAHLERAIPINESDTLHLIDFLPDSSSAFRGIVLYFHGNRKHIGFYANQTPVMTRAGYRVLMIDYPGYGKSSGRLTEQKLYDWSEIVYRIAHKQVAADSIIIFGKSLGTGIATRLASMRSCKNLILETPYYDLPSVAARFLPLYPTRWLMHYEFPLHQFLKEVSAPVFIFHGTNDEVIGLKQSLRLRSALKPSDRFLIVPGGKHNGLQADRAVQHALDSIFTR